MKVIVVCLFLILYQTSVSSQNLYSISTAWDDNFKQWVILADEGEVEGAIDMKWRLKNDISEWSYRIENKRGSLIQKWDNNLNVWELRSMESIITISTVWSGDFSSWRISNGDHFIKVERENYLNDPAEWTISDEKNGKFFWYNEYRNDLRDWVIIDELSEEVTFDMKLAAVFIAILFEVYK